jgi:hypothetical protein
MGAEAQKTWIIIVQGGDVDLLAGLICNSVLAWASQEDICPVCPVPNPASKKLCYAHFQTVE